MTQQFHSLLYTQEKWNTYSRENIYITVHRIIIHNNQKEKQPECQPTVNG